MGCSLTSPVDCGGELVGGVGDVIGGAAGGVADSVAENTIGKLADSVADSVADGLASLGTLWVNIDTPDLVNGSGQAANEGAVPPGSSNVVQVLEYMTYVGLVVCVLSLMVAGVRFARAARGDVEEGTVRVGTVLLATILISGASALIGAVFRDGRVGGGSETVGFVQNSLWFYTMVIAVISVIFAGIKMAWEQRAQPGRDLVRSILTLMLITGAALPVLGLLIDATDAFSRWVISSSLDCDPTVGDGSCFGDNLSKLIQLGAAGSGPGLGAPFMVIVLGTIALITSLVQIALMVARTGMLVVLAGVLPWTAAATNTEMGQAWFKRALAWLVAWLLYKPAAAIVYATAFNLAGSDLFTDDGSGLIKVVTGLMLMILAIVALPALMRFVTPAVSALASGGSSSMTMAMAAAPAMGAVSTLGRFADGASDNGGSGGGQWGGQWGSGQGADGAPGARGAQGAVDHGGSQTGQLAGLSGGGGAGGGAKAGAGATGAKAEASGGAAAGGGAAGGAAGGSAAAGAAVGPAAVPIVAAEALGSAAQAARGAAQSAADHAAGDAGGGAGGATGSGPSRSDGANGSEGSSR